MLAVVDGFLHDQFACGRRFRLLNIVDDVTRMCLAILHGRTTLPLTALFGGPTKFHGVAPGSGGR